MYTKVSRDQTRSAPPEQQDAGHAAPDWGHPGASGAPIDFRSAGAAIRTGRAYAQLSQRDLAEKAGVSHATIARIEGNRTEPRWSTVQRCLRACGFRIALVNDVGEVIDHAPLVLERDRAGRHYPAHLRVRRVGKPEDWWNGGGRQPRVVLLEECPPFTFTRYRRSSPTDEEAQSA